jgi:S-formylglutathione hydrolase FrmB
MVRVSVGSHRRGAAGGGPGGRRRVPQRRYGLSRRPRPWFLPAQALTVLAACAALIGMPQGVARLAKSDVRVTADEHGIVQHIEVRGPSDQQPHDVWVWRPPGADSALMPVLYVLHGVPGSANDPFQHGLAKILDDRLRAGDAPFVVASPDGNGEHYYDSEWADSADGSDDVESRFLDAVIPAVEGSHLRDGAHRAIAGFSMGGYGAMNITLRHPSLFDQVVSIAGYFRPDDESGVFQGEGNMLAANAPDQHLGNARGKHILLCEDSSDSFPLIQGQAASFYKLLGADHIPATLRITSGQHDWDYAIGALDSSFDFLSNGWR